MWIHDEILYKCRCFWVILLIYRVNWSTIFKRTFRLCLRTTPNACMHHLRKQSREFQHYDRTECNSSSSSSSTQKSTKKLEYLELLYSVHWMNWKPPRITNTKTQLHCVLIRCKIYLCSGPLQKIFSCVYVSKKAYKRKFLCTAKKRWTNHQIKRVYSSSTTFITRFIVPQKIFCFLLMRQQKKTKMIHW